MAYSTITKPSDYFNTKLWTGTGSNGNAISGVGFAPDWVWVKNRSETFDHVLFDRVRGDNKHLETNNTSAEENEAYTLAFGSDGYSVGTNTLNKSGNNIVGWNWKANGTGSSNSGGNITSTVSANTTAGFSIVKYTGTGSATTVGHGLGAIPKMIIIKGITNTSAENWRVFHDSVSTGRLVLNDNDEVSNSTDFGANGSGGTITQNINYFNIGDNARVNGSGDEFIAYCFAEKRGYSKFGKYTGNGNADGTFAYLGFKPAFVMIKLSSATADWQIFDNKREGYNNANDNLYPNLNSAEGSTARIQLLSNGFKIIDNNNWGWNKTAQTYIYMAIAAEPLVANVGASVPATAR